MTTRIMAWCTQRLSMHLVKTALIGRGIIIRDGYKNYATVIRYVRKLHNTCIERLCKILNIDEKYREIINDYIVLTYCLHDIGKALRCYQKDIERVYNEKDKRCRLSSEKLDKILKELPEKYRDTLRKVLEEFGIDRLGCPLTKLENQELMCPRRLIYERSITEKLLSRIPDTALCNCRIRPSFIYHEFHSTIIAWHIFSNISQLVKIDNKKLRNLTLICTTAILMHHYASRNINDIYNEFKSEYLKYPITPEDVDYIRKVAIKSINILLKNDIIKTIDKRIIIETIKEALELLKQKLEKSTIGLTDIINNIVRTYETKYYNYILASLCIADSLDSFIGRKTGKPTSLIREIHSIFLSSSST